MRGALIRGLILHCSPLTKYTALGFDSQRATKSCDGVNVVSKLSNAGLLLWLSLSPPPPTLPLALPLSVRVCFLCQGGQPAPARADGCVSFSFILQRRFSSEPLCSSRCTNAGDRWHPPVSLPPSRPPRRLGSPPLSRKRVSVRVRCRDRLTVGLR